MSKNIKVNINDKFWSPKLKIFREVTLPDTLNKLEQDGAVENFKKVISGSGRHEICPWHDGLLYETIRGASDYLAQARDENIESRIDRYADIIAQAQQAAGGGYISTYTLLERKSQRYGENGGNIIWQHDIYNCGCLFEAGVHYYLATGKAKLLECAVKCANELCEVIGKSPKKWIVPDHSLPEYALLELYELVKDENYAQDIRAKIKADIEPEKYLELADFWVRGRGHHEHRTNHPQYMGEYAQDHAPIHEQFQAVGHAVRAVLYYTGVTRLAIMQNDKQLLTDSLRLWENVTQRKLHINGGVGATHFEEKFGEDYDLRNDAYLETCASVGLIFWAKALFDAEYDGKYYDIIERALYNIMLSSVSLQGDAYFYRNPLVSKGNDHHWSWNGCPCCPPMIHKLFGAFHEYIYSVKENTCYVNLFVSGEAEIKLKDGSITLTQESNYPWGGNIKFTVKEVTGDIKIALRLPESSDGNRGFQLGGEIDIVHPNKGRYVFLENIKAGDEFEFRADMSVKRIRVHPYVRENRGHVAVQRGPLVYCVEGIDNSGKTDFIIAEEPDFTETYEKDLLGGVMTINGTASDGQRFKMVPLYAWDNRMACAMQVWLRQENIPEIDDNKFTLDWEIMQDCSQLYRRYK